MREAAQYHLTWYDLGDAAPWQQGWADGGCLKEVQDRLGYRLQLSHLSHQSAAARGEHLTVTVALSNVGWSRVPSERRLRVVLQRDATVLSSDGDTDLRTLPPQAAADTTLQVGFTVPTDAPTGLYQVSLQIPAPAAPTVADYAIRFANLDDAAHQQRWAPATFRFSTGTTVDIR